MPDELEYLWAHFVEIMNGVASNGFGPTMITWADIAAWCELTVEILEPWEARAIVTLSARRANILAETTETKSGNGSHKN